MNLQLPSHEQQILIRQAFNEDVNTRDKDLEAIKEWMRKQPHLPDSWDETMLMHFLRSCSFSLEKTKKRLDKYFTVKAAVPEFFTDRDITKPEMQKILNLIEVGTLPQMTPQARRVHVLRLVTSDFDDFDYNVFIKLSFMFCDIVLHLEKMGTAGEIYVVDTRNFMLKHVIKLTPSLIKKYLICVFDAIPIKVKGVHLIHNTTLIDTVMALAKPFIKEKIFKRIHIHRDLTTLHEHISRDLLLEDFGGTQGTLRMYTDMYLQACNDFQPWLKEQENIKADESKRPEQSACYEELFGLPGSFRQLKID